MTILGDVAELIRGVTFKPTQLVSAEGEGAVGCLRTKNVQAELEMSDLLHVQANVVKQSRQYLRAGDVVISSANSWNLIGKAAWAPEFSRPMTFGGFLTVLRATTDRVDARYLYRWFTSAGVQARVRSFAQQTTNIANLNLERTLGLGIPLPPLPEQRRIASILDETDDLRRTNQMAITLTGQLIRSTFDFLFDFANIRRRALADVAVFFAGNSLPGGEFFAGQEGGVLHLKVSDMNRRGNEREIASAANWSARLGSRAASAPAGSIIIPKRGGAIGTNKKRLLSRPAVLDPNLMAISPRPEALTSEYLFAWFERLDLGTLVTGSSVPQLNKQDLAPLEIAVPSLETQAEFEAIVLRNSKLRDRLEARQAKLDELFASLQYRAFRGEL